MSITALKPTQETVDLVAGLDGKWHGSYAMCVCPAHADRSPSLSIRQGRNGILVHCFAGCANNDVLREISRSTPIRNSPKPDYRASSATGNAIRLWDQSIEIGATPAQVYLRSRNLPDQQHDLRYHPRCPFGRKPNAKFVPAVMVAIRFGQNINAIQRIRLNKTATAHEGKFMLGRPGQGAWAPRFSGTTLAIAESMEDAAAYTKLHGTPCWSALGGERLALIRIPDHVDRLIIAEDNNDPGRLGALAAMEAHARQGLTIERDPPPRRYGDWAEVNEARSI